MCGVKSYNKCSKCSLLALTQAHNRLATVLLVYCLVDNTLFEVSPEIRCSGVKVARYTVVLKTTQLILSQLKNFLS